MTKTALAAILFLSMGAVAEAPPETQWPPFPQPARLTFVDSYTGVPPEAPKTGWGRVLRLILGIAELRGRRGVRPLLHPTGLFVRGRVLYVADPGAHGVLRYDELERRAEWLPSAWKGTLQSPVAVAAAPDGRIFVADSELQKVVILGPDGGVSGELKGDPEGLGRPAGLALGPERLYVSDASRHRVSIYHLDGAFVSSFGRRGTALGEFNYPTYLWFDAPTQRLWVCDSGNFRLQTFSEEGRPLGTIGENGDRPGFLARPRGVALDSDGDVYSIDGAFEALQILDEKGRLLLFVGREGARPGEFSLPGGLFIDSEDRVFVADTYNARVQVFQYRKSKGEGRP